jgi:transcriptional regulator with XRE-family HTH domain
MCDDLYNEAMATSDLLRRHMERKGMTIVDLARRSGVGVATISRIINGHYEPRQSTREKIAAALGVSVRQLVE